MRAPISINQKQIIQFGSPNNAKSNATPSSPNSEQKGVQVVRATSEAPKLGQKFIDRTKENERALAREQARTDIGEKAKENIQHEELKLGIEGMHPSQIAMTYPARAIGTSSFRGFRTGRRNQEARCKEH